MFPWWVGPRLLDIVINFSKVFLRRSFKILTKNILFPKFKGGKQLMIGLSYKALCYYDLVFPRQIPISEILKSLDENDTGVEN